MTGFRGVARLAAGSVRGLGGERRGMGNFEKLGVLVIIILAVVIMMLVAVSD